MLIEPNTAIAMPANFCMEPDSSFSMTASMAVKTGMVGCMHVATSTPDKDMPRMYSSWLKKRQTPSAATCSRSWRLGSVPAGSSMQGKHQCCFEKQSHQIQSKQLSIVCRQGTVCKHASCVKCSSTSSSLTTRKQGQQLMFKARCKGRALCACMPALLSAAVTAVVDNQKEAQQLTFEGPSHAAHYWGSNSLSDKRIHNGVKVLSTTAVHCSESSFQVYRATTKRDLGEG